MANQNDTDTAEAARRRAIRARMARLRKESPFKKKTGESTNTSNFGAMGARGKRKPPTLPEGAQGRAESGAENQQVTAE